MKRLENGNFELTHDELEKLIACREELCAVEGAGVDNWEGYGYRWEYLEESGHDSFYDLAKDIISEI